jgi:hypothetical protein
MRALLVLTISLFALAGCDKLGVNGVVNQAVGNWAEVKLPDGCTARQVSAEEKGGVAVLCADGRVFH